MSKVISSVVAGFIIGSLSGCTSLQSQKLTSTSTFTPEGITYRLPAKQYSVSVNYEIIGCVAEGTNANLEAKVKASISESLIGAEAYTVDYQKLNGLTKVTNTEFNLSESGILTGINATITDKTGAVFENLVKTASGITRARNIPAIGTLDNNALSTLETKALKSGDTFNLLDALGVQNENQVNQYGVFSTFNNVTLDQALISRVKQAIADAKKPCNSINNAIAELDKKQRELKKEKKNDQKRAKIIAKIETYNNKISALKLMVETYAALGSSSDKKQLLGRIKLLEKSKEESKADLIVLGESNTEDISKKIVILKGKLNVTATEHFVPVSPGEIMQINASAEELEILAKGNLKVQDIKLPEVSIAIKPISNVVYSQSKLEPKTTVGVAYRVPVAAKAVLTCKCSQGKPSVLASTTTFVPQFGPIGSIDLDNLLFDDNSIVATFNPTNGALTKLTFNAKSKAEAASGSLMNAADTYLQLKKSQNLDIIEYNESLATKLQKEIDLEKSQLDLSTAQSDALSNIEIKGAALQKTLIDAEIQAIRDQQRLDAVRTGTATQAEIELEALKNQELLLEQQLKIIKLQNKIEEEKAKAELGATDTF